MKRSGSPLQEQNKRQKITFVLLDENDLEIVTTFSELNSYPTDVIILGRDFKIAVHGYPLSVISESLKAILCQPGNSNGNRTWELSPAMTKNGTVQFLMQIYIKTGYEGAQTDFETLNLEDFGSYIELCNMHLGNVGKNSVGDFLKNRILRYSKYVKSKQKFWLDLAAKYKIEFENSKVLRQLVFMYAGLPSICPSSQSSLKLDMYHFTYFKYLLAQSHMGLRKIIFCYAVLLSIALQNDVPFEDLELADMTVPDCKSISSSMLGDFMQMMKVRLPASIPDARMHEMAFKSMLWILKRD